MNVDKVFGEFELYSDQNLGEVIYIFSSLADALTCK